MGGVRWQADVTPLTPSVGQPVRFTLTVPAALLEPTVVTIPVEAGSLVLVLDDDPGMREQWRMLLWEQDVVCERFT